MAANILLVVTNLPFAYSAIRAINRGQVLPAAMLSFAGLASMAYHGSETYKHPVLPGLGYAKSRRAQMILLNIDRLGAATAFLAVVGAGPAWRKYIPHGIALVLANVMSELVAPRLNRQMHLAVHLVCHSIWHLGVFVLADRVLYNE